jgi:hypothetical protein
MKKTVLTTLVSVFLVTPAIANDSDYWGSDFTNTATAEYVETGSTNDYWGEHFEDSKVQQYVELESDNELEPTINGLVSELGLFPTQAEENIFLKAKAERVTYNEENLL